LDALRVRNVGIEPCAFAGKDPVVVPWWRVEPPGPSRVIGVLGPGSVLVQPYKFERSNGCPYMPEGTTQVIVLVDQRSFQLTVTAQLAHEIQDCLVVSALPIRVEPAR